MTITCSLCGEEFDPSEPCYCDKTKVNMIKYKCASCGSPFTYEWRINRYVCTNRECPAYHIKYMQEDIAYNDVVSDNVVEHPSHYNWIPGIECMDVVKHFDFPTGNVMKYCWRAGYKKTSTKLEDLKKAKYYIDIAIEMEEKNV